MHGPFTMSINYYIENYYIEINLFHRNKQIELLLHVLVIVRNANFMLILHPPVINASLGEPG